MPIEVELPEEIELTIRKDRELKKLIKQRIEKDLTKAIKKGVFHSLLFDKLLKSSELSEKDIAKLDRKMKKEIREKIGWSW